MRRAGVLFCFFGVSLFGADTYLVHNLVADLPSTADHTDPNLVNPWGNAFTGSGPFWIGNNGSGTSTLYTTSGSIIPLVVAIPPPGGAAASAKGTPTGVIFNGSTSFAVTSGNPALFLFCTNDGTISGWNISVDRTHAKLLADNSKSGAVYKGCATGTTSAGANMLYAANFNSGNIDMWDGNFNPVTSTGAFANPAIPSGFAPFNIQNLGGTLYVTYAKQDAAKQEAVPGAGNGYVAAFDTSGKLIATLVSGGVLNTPWGVAIAPSTFGDFSGALLVANFADGLIHAFNATSGGLMGALTDPKGAPIAIPGMWSINFGNGGSGGDKSTLYFTAGVGGANGAPLGSHGLLGSIQPPPSLATAGVLNGASFSSAIAPNTWVTLKGGALSETTRSWESSDFKGTALPTVLDNVSVTINGEAAYVAFISPSQINFLAPADLAPGPVTIQVTNNGLTSAIVSAIVQTAAPAFFTIGATNSAGNSYIAATHADGALAGPPKLITGATTTPFNPGEIAVLYANGCDNTASAVPNGQILPAPILLQAPPVVMIGGQPAQVQFAGLSATGLYQFNVVIPSGLTLTGTGNVDVPVVIQTSGAQTQDKAVISVAVPTT